MELYACIREGLADIEIGHACTFSDAMAAIKYGLKKMQYRRMLVVKNYIVFYKIDEKEKMLILSDPCTRKTIGWQFCEMK